MKVYDAPSIRNVSFVGHSGSGKTQLASTILFDTEMVNRLGQVDDGTTVTDFDEEAIARKHTLSASIAHAEWNKHKINIIDTPGMANFLSEAQAALQISDAAVIVVDAVAGVEVQTEKVWNTAHEFGLPRLLILNRLDLERASLERALGSLQDVFGRKVVPVQLPLGEEKSFHGVIDLVSMQELVFDSDGSGKFSAQEVQAESTEKANAARETLIEVIAETDDTLMEKFFEAGTLTQQELNEGLKTATRAGLVFPLFCTSATLNIGIQPVLESILTYLPSPADRPFSGVDRSSNEPVICEAKESHPYAAFVWKTIADPFAGKITMFRAVSGSLKSDTTIHNLTKDESERLGHLMILQGKTQSTVTEIKAGDLGAVAKLKNTHTGDTLGDNTNTVSFAPFKYAETVLSYAIEPKSRGDEEKISSALQRLTEEDPTIQYGRDLKTNELLLSGQGQLHIEVTVAKLKRRFGVEVNLNLPRIPYRETISTHTEAHGRHKKQSGGHGQFGDCKIRVEPLERGSEFEFANEIFGGSIPRQFIPAVEKGVNEARMQGFLAGYPVVDFKVTVFDGSFHPVDSNELSFKLAGSHAFKDAMTRAKPTILEPIMNVEIYAPNEFAGDLMGDLNSRRGRIGGMEPRGVMTSIKAQVPMAEMLTYEQQLTSATGGRGSYHMEFLQYEEVPTHLQGKIIEASKNEGSTVSKDED